MKRAGAARAAPAPYRKSFGRAPGRRAAGPAIVTVSRNVSDGVTQSPTLRVT